MGTSCELICTALMLCVFSAAVMAAAEEGSASGWLEVKGQRTLLKSAFAAMAEDVTEGKGKEKIEVLLSDKPVPPELRKATDAWSFWAGELASKGELHGIILYITPDTKVWSRGQMLSNLGLTFYWQSATPPEANDLVFAPAAAGSGEIAGKVSMKQAMSGLAEGGGPWRVEAEFRTAVIARPTVSATLTGAAAKSSEPYRAVQAYVQACLKKDLEAIKRAMNSNAQSILAQFLASRSKSDLLKMLAGEAAETLKMKLTKVTVRGDTAEVEFSEGAGDSTSQQTMRVVLENGAWKIGQ